MNSDYEVIRSYINSHLQFRLNFFCLSNGFRAGHL